MTERLVRGLVAFLWVWVQCACEVGANVELIEKHLGKTAVKQLLPMQPGDIPATSVDTTALEETTQFTPHVCIEDGIRQFCEWFSAYHSSGA